MDWWIDGWMGHGGEGVRWWRKGRRGPRGDPKWQMADGRWRRFEVAGLGGRAGVFEPLDGFGQGVAGGVLGDGGLAVF